MHIVDEVRKTHIIPPALQLQNALILKTIDKLL